MHSLKMWIFVESAPNSVFAISLSFFLEVYVLYAYFANGKPLKFVQKTFPWLAALLWTNASLYTGEGNT